MHVTSWEDVTPPGLAAGSGGRATRDSVIDAFAGAVSPFEGVADVMYTDKLGLVTTAIGYLIDSNSNKTPMADMNAYGPALLIPWVRKSDGQPATQAEIIQDWQTVKSAHTQTGSFDLPNDRKITQLKISPLVIQDLTASRMATNEKELLKSFPGFAKFPADAQLAIHVMAWAMGSAFVPVDHFEKFAMAANAGNWEAAKAASGYGGEEPKRKAALAQMFDNAAAVQAGHLDPGVLWYPRSAPTTAIGSLLATLRRPAVAAGVTLSVFALGAGIYWATRRPAAKRLPARA